MTDLSASFGLWQFKNIDKWHKRRCQIAKRYITLLNSIEGINLPRDLEGHAWHLFVIRIKLDKWKITRNEIIKLLNDQGIGLAVHYKPINYLSYYKKNYKLNQDDFFNANHLFQSIISIPIYPLLTDLEVDYISNSIKNIYKKNSV